MQQTHANAVVRPEEPISGILGALLEVFSDVPPPQTAPSATPYTDSRATISAAAAKAGLISGAAGMVPGPLGLLSIVPDLIAVWRVQRQMVADVAGLYGKSAFLGRETMLACLFRHSAAQLVRDVIVRAGQKWLVRRTSTRALQALLGRISVRLAQRLGGKALARWLPFVGGVLVGAYAVYDTRQVGEAAIELFSSELVLVEEG